MMDDPHERFQAWLLLGTPGDPARDLALHASVCPDCLRWISAYDALTTIDVGRARLPPWKSRQRRPTAMLRVGRLVAVAASLVLLGWAIAFGVSQLLAGPAAGDRTGQVLSATGIPAASPQATQ
jgi:hypothetical protein